MNGLVQGSRLARLLVACERCSRLPGAFIEIGVFRGGTLAKIAAFGRPTFGFDTFEGIPASQVDQGGHLAGEFAASLADVQAAVPKATLIPGVFPESWLDRFPVALAHVDVDTYAGTRDALAAILPQLVPGGVVIVDDAAWPPCAGVDEALAEIEPPWRVDCFVSVTGPGQAVISR